MSACSIRALVLLAVALAAGADTPPFSVAAFEAAYKRSLPEEARRDLLAALGQVPDRRVPEVLGRIFRDEQACPYLQSWIVKILCEEVGSPEALKRVAEALKDRKTPKAVALLAERALADVQSPEGLAWMAGDGLKDPATREAMGWALALDAGFKDSAFFLGHLAGEKDWRLRTASAAGLWRTASPDVAGKLLDALHEETAPPVLRYLLPAAGRVAPAEALPLLEAALGSADPRTRLGAIEGLGAAGADSGAREKVLSLLEGALSKEPGCLRADAARVLETLTGKPHKFEAPEFFGIPLCSKRVVVLIDASHDMTWDREALQPADRLARARKELGRVLEVLPPDAQAGAAAFGLSVSRWQDGLAAVTPDARKSAQAWASHLDGVGGPDFGAGLEAAWKLGVPPEDGGADTVILISNGLSAGESPSGELGAPSDLLRWLMIASRYRSVVIHAVGIGSGGDKALLKALAAQTGGQFRNAD